MRRGDGGQPAGIGDPSLLLRGTCLLLGLDLGLGRLGSTRLRLRGAGLGLLRAVARLCEAGPGERRLLPGFASLGEREAGEADGDRER